MTNSYSIIAEPFLFCCPIVFACFKEPKYTNDDTNAAINKTENAYKADYDVTLEHEHLTHSLAIPLLGRCLCRYFSRYDRTVVLTTWFAI